MISPWDSFTQSTRTRSPERVLTVSTRRSSRLASRAEGSAPKRSRRSTRCLCTAFQRGSAARGKGRSKSHFTCKPRPLKRIREGSGISSSWQKPPDKVSHGLRRINPPGGFVGIQVNKAEVQAEKVDHPAV